MEDKVVVIKKDKIEPELAPERQTKAFTNAICIVDEKGDPSIPQGWFGHFELFRTWLGKRGRLKEIIGWVNVA